MGIGDCSLQVRVLNRNLGSYVWPGVVAFEFKVVVVKTEQVFYIGIEFDAWQWTRFACELDAGLFQMIKLEMRVACCVNEFARLESGGLGCHHE